MKSILTLIFSVFTLNILAQANKFDYPDTLWVYSNSNENDYGRSPQNPIKIGGGVLPKHVYRYLNSLADSSGKRVSFERIGSVQRKNLESKKLLTSFKVAYQGKVETIYFDQYSWDNPKIVKGFTWKEQRKGYHGEFKNDTIFNGYGIYFFEDGGYYKGQWSDGIMSGKGALHIPGKETYTGEFAEDKYNGLGTLNYPDGGRYVGNFENGQRHGVGILYYPPKSAFKSMEGTFEKDKPKGAFKVLKSNGKVEDKWFE